MAARPLFANHCPFCFGPLTAIDPVEWACETCQVTYEPCGNYLILKHVSLVGTEENTATSDDLVAH